jgi:hypothetical protein
MTIFRVFRVSAPGLSVPVPVIECNCIIGEGRFFHAGRLYCVREVICDENHVHARTLVTQPCQLQHLPGQSFESMMRRFYPTRVVVDGEVHVADVDVCPGCYAEQIQHQH